MKLRSGMLWMAVIGLTACVCVDRLGADDFPREGQRVAKDRLEGKTPPALDISTWVNVQGQIPNWTNLKGKVVVIDFWGTFCAPCHAALPKLKALHEKHKDNGLVIIGIHLTEQGHTMTDYVFRNNVPWPVGVDRAERTFNAFAADACPDYYIIDRSGKLRVADLANDALVETVETLLAEPAE